MPAGRPTSHLPDAMYNNTTRERATCYGPNLYYVSTCVQDVVSRILSSYGDRTFAAAGPRLWNSLPVQLRNSDIIYGLFRRQLNGHLLREARTQCSVTSYMRRHGKTLTYLLTYIDLLWICCRRRTKLVLLYVCCVLYITLSTTIVVASVRCTTNRGNGVWAYSC